QFARTAVSRLSLEGWGGSATGVRSSAVLETIRGEGPNRGRSEGIIRQSRSCPVRLGSPAMVDPPAASGLAELPHLSTFVRVAEEGGFTAAASDLGLTQAAVSQRIAALERELRVSLFDRRAGRIFLTEAGQRLYEYARRILDLHERARSDL